MTDNQVFYKFLAGNLASSHDSEFYYPAPTYDLKRKKWKPGAWVSAPDLTKKTMQEEQGQPCGHGLHLMKVPKPVYVRYSGNAYVAEGRELLGEDNEKARFKQIRLIRPLAFTEIFHPKAYLSGADLSGADLSGADLSGAYLFGAYLYGAYLSGANLFGADLFGADLSRADLSRANLSRANLSEANLYGANLSEANLYGANLSRANLYGANLSRANLSRANLYGADLSEANLYGANLSEANLSEADLSRANLSGAKDGKFSDEQLKQCYRKPNGEKP